MNDRNLLGPWIRRFMLEHMVAERNFSPNTQASYRDTLTLLLPFAAKLGGFAIDRMTVEDLSPTIVRQFLDHVECDRHCGGATRNVRLSALHSLARFIGMHSPVHLSWCGEVRSIPFKKTAMTLVGYLEKSEMNALLAAPDRRTAIGARDYALLLFLYNSGARADEAAKLTIGRLQLTEPSSVRILGKGNKMRVCPLWPTTSSVLTQLVTGRSAEDTVFRGRTNQPMTRFGIHRIVTQYAKLVTKSHPAMKDKRISPHSVRHYIPFRIMSGGTIELRRSIDNFASKSRCAQATIRHNFKGL
ncbi:site-specific recombinase XerD [Paraburkholderia sp. BL6665CI2N2]|uniref:tyrosine-type recombinase/integrase n=1 Tax=Paraburkholderia sp. BL6665CI2N2 TaxID=1938806 RepID=UPI0010654BB5|nr:tyrosine-type recombinase/integrase [Paraburkholderia sp. BL6665CI2N2]TDY16790.1 site-specific recombinase XerD [Paraburkholderia sp. BL6665CI2N2]